MRGFGDKPTRRKVAEEAGQLIQVRISGDTPDAYKDRHREYLMPLNDAILLTLDLQEALKRLGIQIDRIEY